MPEWRQLILYISMWKMSSHKPVCVILVNKGHACLRSYSCMFSHTLMFIHFANYFIRMTFIHDQIVLISNADLLVNRLFRLTKKKSSHLSLNVFLYFHFLWTVGWLYRKCSQEVFSSCWVDESSLSLAPMQKNGLQRGGFVGWWNKKSIVACHE